MAERAAHLVDLVFPDVPVRQWVLSLPYRLRYRLAWDHDLCRAVVAVYLRAVLGWLRRRAHAEGVTDGRGGAVAIVQRFGGALNLNVHVHALVLDGVFAVGRSDVVGFHPAPRLTTLDVEEVLAGLAAASVQGTVALGRHRGARVRRLGDPPEAAETPAFGGCHARSNGFDLHAGLVVPAGQRERLERVCRYALRPPVARDRLSLTGERQVLLQLRHPWHDGTTHLVFDPVEFLGRLAVLVPRPRVNLVLYYGVLGARAAWRSQVVRRETSDGGGDVRLAGNPTAPAGQVDTPDAAQRRARGRLWADLMRRTFGFDVLECPQCRGRLRLIALIDQAAVIQRILCHLGLTAEIPDPCSARAPPLPTDRGACPMDDTDTAFDPCL